MPWDEGMSGRCKLKAMLSALQTLPRVLNSAALVRSAALTSPEAELLSARLKTGGHLLLLIFTEKFNQRDFLR